MKRTLDRTKVVLRHLPPSITEAMLIEQVDSAFAGRYNWFSFRPGKNGQKHQSCSRLYIDFKSPEDVLEFAEFFNGHVFVNEKGAQFKTIVEYAPSQCVPTLWAKNDDCEGNIFKDPEYLEFLEFLAKPVENLPSAEIQLERREAERVGALKDSSIVTPLMDFVRQKRAAKVGSRKSLSNGKLSRRAGGQSGGIPSSASSKRGSEKRRGSTTMYVLRDSLKNASGKDKSKYILVSRRDEQQLSNRPVILASSVGTEVSEEESGATRITDADKNKVLLLKGKGKEKEISHVAGSILHQQNFTSPIKTILRSTPTKLNSRRENRIIRGILLNKDSRQSQCAGFQSEQHIETSHLEKERRPTWHPHANLGLKDACNASDGNVAGNHLHGAKKLERRSRNKDRTDHGVWTLRHSDGSCASDESLSSSASQSAQILIDSSEGACGDNKVDFSSVGSWQGSSKHVSRRVAVANGSSAVNDGKPGKRANVYGSHEKQVWVQKSSSGS
ncbi:hypothetical protein ERO13_D02G237100v2 [Gossypium hirsutum]|uniref:Regulator of nonsense transcripts UPF3 isoform X4 n=2 Tax=Gossypium TaxID=3633 RepID=A0ABM2ZRF9_GOSHI|nr:regulator of nonsense transcripts UPF3-like isoform X4 [Gossypium hirsutum]KAG4160432.1 hypothetical protein ERO13_D02G237100v2 [Gossypium hirsutum]TYH85773.1 hypothetical protein ES332_D02G292500v1 [Gossypium tomentosum]